MSAFGVDLSKIPVGPSPNGEPPNFVNPVSNHSTVVGVGLSLSIITLFFVILRLATNSTVAKKLGWDDFLCVAAYTLVTMYFGVTAAFKSTSRHTWDIPVSHINAGYAKRIFATNIIVGPAIWSSKAAILSLYMRLFEIVRWLRITSLVALVVTFLFFWANIPLAGIFCTPRVGETWNVTVLRRCQGLAVVGPVQGVVGVVADIFILVLPLPVIYKLNLAPKRKVGLAAVFMVGVFAVAASAVSLYYRVNIYRGEDTFWNTQNIWACVLAEGYVTIIVSCAPAVSAFWTNTVKKSALYSRLRSRLSLSRATRSTTTKTTSSSFPEKPVSFPSSAHHVHDNNDYYELNDVAYPEPSSDLYPTAKKFVIMA